LLLEKVEELLVLGLLPVLMNKFIYINTLMSEVKELDICSRGILPRAVFSYLTPKYY